jgi:hypothetical protein
MGRADNGWTQLLTALHTAGKNVALDLSASTRSSNGDFDTGVTFDTIPNGMHNIVSIVLPNTTVTTIGQNAFRNCTSLMNITIPDSVTIIGVSAFQGCTGLISVTIPDSVTTIDFGAFQGCTGLMSATIGSGVTTINGAAFLNCIGLTSVTVFATTPPTLVGGVFDGGWPPTPLPNLTIRVPAGSVDAYRAAANWSDYADIIVAIP